jgi:hypothetical protein
MLGQFVSVEITLIRCTITAHDRLLSGGESKHHFSCFTFVALFCCVTLQLCQSRICRVIRTIIDGLREGFTVLRLMSFSLIGCHHIISQSTSLSSPLMYKGN